MEGGGSYCQSRSWLHATRIIEGSSQWPTKKRRRRRKIDEGGTVGQIRRNGGKEGKYTKMKELDSLGYNPANTPQLLLNPSLLNTRILLPHIIRKPETNYG